MSQTKIPAELFPGITKSPAPPDTISIKTDGSKHKAAVVSAGPGLLQHHVAARDSGAGAEAVCSLSYGEIHQLPPRSFGGVIELDLLRVISTTGNHSRGVSLRVSHRVRVRASDSCI